MPHSSRARASSVRTTHPAGMAPMCLYYHRVFVRVLRPALWHAMDESAASPSLLNRLINRFDREIQRLWEGIPLAA